MIGSKKNQTKQNKFKFRICDRPPFEQSELNQQMQPKQLVEQKTATKNDEQHSTPSEQQHATILQNYPFQVTREKNKILNLARKKIEMDFETYSIRYAMVTFL